MKTKQKQSGMSHIATTALGLLVVAVVAFAGVRIVDQSSAYYVSELGTYGCKSTATLRSGSKGNCVKALQYGLNNWITYHNYNITALKVDGDFGKATKDAVMAYQKKRDLKADGVVGSATWGKFLVDCSVFKTCKPTK